MTPDPPTPGRPADTARAAELLLSGRQIWLGTHVDPDADTIGSALGLALALRSLGREVTVACADPPPREAMRLPGIEGLTDAPAAGHDVLVALDTGDEGRLGPLFERETWTRARTLVIDHHLANPAFGDVNLIDPTAASTAELVLDVVTALGAELTRDVATCLLTGIVTDTLGFRTSNTSPATLRAAVALVEAGAPLSDIAQWVFFSRPLAALELAGRVLSTVRHEPPFAIATLSRADMAACGAGAEDTKGLVGLLATAAEPAAVALVRERDDGRIDVSFRSRPGVDVSTAARALGGGGHAQAAGARLEPPLEDAAARVLGALRAHVEAPLPVPAATGPGTAGRSRRGSG